MGHLNKNFNAPEDFGKKHKMEFFVEGALHFYFERTTAVLTKLEQELTEECTCQIEHFIDIYATQASALEVRNILRSMDLSRLLEQVAETRQSLFEEGHLNENFTALENYGTTHRMEFYAQDSVNFCFEMTANLFARLEEEIKDVPLDLDLVTNLVNQLKHCYISVGAAKVHSKVTEFGTRIVYGIERRMGYRNDPQSLQEALREVKLEHERFKGKIELYFRMKVWDPPTVIDDNPGFEDEESSDEE